MESMFKSGFRSFLESSYIDFIEYGNQFIFPDYDFSVELVPAGKPLAFSPLWNSENLHNGSTNYGSTTITEDALAVRSGDTLHNAGPNYGSTTITEDAPAVRSVDTLQDASSDVIHSVTPDTGDKVYLFEDRWWSAREMVQERILARLERFRSIFARKCKVLSGRGNPAIAEQVRDFLQRHHSYSSAKCRYRYALEYEGEIVAVATFSEGRPMVRKIGSMLQNVPKEDQKNADILIFDSYEWIRYASLPGVRVVGGMGRLLNAFIEERYTRIEPGTPLEVMTYSDSEWGSGDVYEKLGFKYAGERSPVEYFVHKGTFARYPQRLYEKELLAGTSPEDFYTIRNLGSKKFLLQLL